MIRPIILLRQKRIVIDIDTQRHFFMDNSKTRIFNKNTVLANIRRVMAWTRLKNIRIISTVQIPAIDACYCNFGGDHTNGLEKISFTLRNRRTQFDAADCTDLPINILEQYDQVIFRKRCIDPFKEPRVDRMLSEFRAEEFILIGSLVEGAIKATALGLLHRRKNVRVLVDAIGSGDKRAAKLALRHMLAKGAKLTYMHTLFGSSALRLARERSCPNF
jgi:nicotinamidase-related amidase